MPEPSATRQGSFAATLAPPFRAPLSSRRARPFSPHSRNGALASQMVRNIRAARPRHLRENARPRRHHALIGPAHWGCGGRLADPRGRCPRRGGGADAPPFRHLAEKVAAQGKRAASLGKPPRFSHLPKQKCPREVPSSPGETQNRHGGFQNRHGEIQNRRREMQNRHGDFQSSHGDFQNGHGGFQFSHGVIQIRHGKTQIRHGKIASSDGGFQTSRGVFQIRHRETRLSAGEFPSALGRDAISPRRAAFAVVYNSVTPRSASPPPRRSACSSAGASAGRSSGR